MGQRNSEYERKPNELYETPEWVTWALLRSSPLLFDSAIWEPCAGSGKMGRVLADGVSTFGGCVIATDIVWKKIDHPGVFQNEGETLDFFKTKSMVEMKHGPLTNIVTNPPFNRATQFIEHALNLLKPVKGKLCLLLSSEFDYAKTRKHLFRDCPAFSEKIQLTRRIKWFDGPPPGKDKEVTPSTNHAWYIWDWEKALYEHSMQLPTIRYYIED
jgi:hypothetical protein